MARFFSGLYISGPAVITEMADLHVLRDHGVVFHGLSDHRHHRRRLFDIIQRAGQYDNILFISFMFHIYERNRIRDAPVQIEAPAGFHRSGYHGHGSGRLEKLQILRSAVRAQMVKRPAGLQVCTYAVEFHGIFGKSLAVKRIKLIGKRVIAEFLPVQISGPEKGTPAGISPVPAEGQIITDRAAMLP